MKKYLFIILLSISPFIAYCEQYGAENPFQGYEQTKQLEAQVQEAQANAQYAQTQAVIAAQQEALNAQQLETQSAPSIIVQEKLLKTQLRYEREKLRQQQSENKILVTKLKEVEAQLAKKDS